MEDFNFNDPIRLTIICRDPIEKEGEMSPEQLMELGIPAVGIRTKDIEYDEYSGQLYVLWDDIASIKTYPYKDTWNKFKGDKYYVALYGQGPEYLVYGNPEVMIKQWCIFRNKYKPYQDGMAKD